MIYLNDMDQLLLSNKSILKGYKQTFQKYNMYSNLLDKYGERDNLNQPHSDRESTHFYPRRDHDGDNHKRPEKPNPWHSFPTYISTSWTKSDSWTNLLPKKNENVTQWPVQKVKKKWSICQRESPYYSNSPSK